MTSTLGTNVNKSTQNHAAANPSPFVWYELHTPDAAAAARFYAPVLGWTTQDSGMSDRKYTMVCVDKTPIGGLLEKDATGFTGGRGARWMPYIGVGDADRYAKLVAQSGGVIHRAPKRFPALAHSRWWPIRKAPSSPFSSRRRA